MMKTFFFVLGLASAIALAQPADQPHGTLPVKRVEQSQIPLEHLAHMFFFHSPDTYELSTIISPQGVERIKPAIIEHQRDMTDLARIAPRVRALCTGLQSASSGEEFATILIQADEREQQEARKGARRVLSKLNPDDRRELEAFLNTEYRSGVGKSMLDYRAMYASQAFPSADSAQVTQRACDSAAEMEARVAP